ncbi:MAG: hypothetical protein ACKOCX_07690 [Planctomycetota bacterium]
MASAIRIDITRRVAALLAGLTLLLALAPPTHAQTPRPVSIRIRWGGGTPQAWQGAISVVPAGQPSGTAPPLPVDWRTLCTEPGAAALTRDTPGGIAIEQPHPIANDGVEITVGDWQRSRLLVQIGPAATGGEPTRLDLLVADILAAPVQRPLDDSGNRLTIELAPGEPLRLTMSARGGDAGRGRVADSTVRRPGDILRFHVDPLLAVKPGEGEFELQLQLRRARHEKVIDTQAAPLVPLGGAPPAAGAAFATGRVPVPFAAVDFEVSLPEQEGVYEVSLEALERGGLRWTRPLASRTVQVVAIAATAAQPPGEEPWSIVYELDPGSPKLHERLRRLPARGLPAVPVPAIAMPTMPLPSLSRPKVPLPKLPEVPLPDVPLPSVPLPDVSAMVPRFGGLLASGHSVVVPHPLGPMLRLPPAPGRDEPAWEGVVIANARPGMPHIVEIEYPSDQRAAVAVCVLEPDATGSIVEVRHAGGFAVAAAGDDAPLGRHRFAFWPTSRNPLVVIANPASTAALVGRMRVTAGPRRLAVARRPVAPETVAATGRPTFALLGTPDLHRRYGGPMHVTAAGGRPVADWVAHLEGIRHSAEILAAGGLAGGAVVVYGDGAAAWPSRLTRQAPRWDPALVGDAGLDPVPKDLLGALVEIYAREGLRIVPAFSFNAAIPALEARLDAEDAAGIACVGGDGRPRRLPGGVHYNVLDPRVQRAVIEIVAEAAGRLAGSPAAAGVAVLLPHDGWLHLPGTAWALDDATFDRFLAAIGGGEETEGPERFANRARLVMGPLREEWLAWRMGEVAAFHARLADAVAAIDARWPLYVMPTTLFAEGDLAGRFRPQLAEADTDDLLRETGLVTALPADWPGAGRLVFVSPHVQAVGGSLESGAVLAAANASLPLAGATARRRGATLLAQALSIDLAAVVPHGPFGTATPPGPLAVSIAPPAAAGDRGLAESLVAADAEAVFDMRAGEVLPEARSAARAAFESLPATPMPPAAGLPAPLVIRTAAAGGVSRFVVVNAGPAAARAVLTLDGRPSAVLDATDGSSLPLDAGGAVAVPLPAWGLRSLVVDGGVGLASASIGYDERVQTDVARRIERLRQRLAVLEQPAALDVLDNPGFELGLDQPAAAGAPPAVTGWELVEARRGSLRLVNGLAGGPRAEAGGRGLEFSSRNGLSTLRSNPFAAPDTGRISVAAWLRVKPGDPQPPLRIAIEGVEEGREYYRFAAVGGLTGGRPLAPEWSLFVLQVDDLPAGRVESMRVRFDLLGPGSVEIDDVRVFDLAFDADQRGQLAKQVARIDHRFKQGDVGGALVALEGHWPAFLEAFVSDDDVAAVVRQAPPVTPRVAEPPAEPRQGMLERVRGWWR